MDIESLLQPRQDGSPSGENLEYDEAFIALEIAAQPGEEQQKGDEIIPAEDPIYGDVLEKAFTVLQRSHDIRAGVMLSDALLNIEGLRGFSEGTRYVRGCLENYWDSCHPQLDADDDNDPTMRINAVKGLSASDTILRSLNRTPLTQSRQYGRFSLRDIQIAHGELPTPEGHAGPDKVKIQGAFEETDPDFVISTVESAKAALANLKAIDGIFAKRTPGSGPDIDRAIKTLQAVVRLIGEYVAQAPSTDAAPAETEVAEMSDEAPRAAAAPRPSAAPGAIGSRDDVLAALDAIGRYYRDYEPSSPVPIILARARRLVKADFMAILKDLAPAGVDNVNIIGGISE